MKTLIKTLKGARIVETQNIIFCEASGKNTKIFLNENIVSDTDAFFIATKILKEIEELLPKSDFYRCHKSYLINFHYFHEFDVEKNCILLSNGTEIKISRTNKPKAKERLLAYIEKYNSF